MRFGKSFAGIALALLAVGPLAAQQSGDRVSVFVRGGGMSALNDLNESGTLEMATGFTFGGGVGYKLHRNIVIRGDLSYAENDMELNGADVGSLNRIFYGAAIQFQLPNSTGLMPYVFAGGGAVTLDPDGGETETKGQGTFGGGVKYGLGQSRFSVFAEGIAYTYKGKVRTSAPTNINVNKTQWDVAWTGGISINLF